MFNIAFGPWNLRYSVGVRKDHHHRYTAGCDGQSIINEFTRLFVDIQTIHLSSSVIILSHIYFIRYSSICRVKEFQHNPSLILRWKNVGRGFRSNWFWQIIWVLVWDVPFWLDTTTDITVSMLIPQLSLFGWNFIPISSRFLVYF